jgi:hypothetical protein
MYKTIFSPLIDHYRYERRTNDVSSFFSFRPAGVVTESNLFFCFGKKNFRMKRKGQGNEKASDHPFIE